jgi:hypothetical protein
VTLTRTRTLAILLIASVLTMTAGQLLAAPTHEICDGMRHGCTTALASCCCGDPSGSNQSRVPSDRTAAGMDSSHGVAAAAVTFDVPAVFVSVAREGLSPVARTPDLRILFRDLRV